MKDFKFWTDCISMGGGSRAGEIVNSIKESSEAISYGTFIRHADVSSLREQKHPALYRFSCPDNWSISFHKGKLPNGELTYYFSWSGIEFFFVDQPIDIEKQLNSLYS